MASGQAMSFDSCAGRQQRGHAFGGGAAAAEAKAGELLARRL